MIRNKKIVVVTPAGRQRYMEILQHYILNNPIVDEWHIWQHTTNIDDIKYFNILKSKSSKIKIINLNENFDKPKFHKFLSLCIEKNTVYIRIDDDIVWIHNEAIQKMIEYRLNNPNPFLVFGNIINNSICDYIHQRKGAFVCEDVLGHICMDRNGWLNPQIAEKKHINFFNKYGQNNLDDYLFDKWVLVGYERFSVNVVCWTGENFLAFNGKVGDDEEEWLSTDGPRIFGKPNEICGQSLFSHFAYNTQRTYLDSTNILSKYKNLAYPNEFFPVKKPLIFF
jgi:hypothetical protein